MSEPEGFAEFVAVRQPALLRLTFALTGNRQASEDLAQTALAKLCPHWNRICIDGDPWAYLRRIVLSTQATWWRRRARGAPTTADFTDLPAAGDAFTASDNRDAVTRWLRTLPARQRAVLVARYLADMSVEETADALGCSTGTVKSQTAKALHHLRATAALGQTDKEDVL